MVWYIFGGGFGNVREGWRGFGGDCGEMVWLKIWLKVGLRVSKSVLWSIW